MPETGQDQYHFNETILGFIHYLRTAEFNVNVEHGVLIGRALTGLSKPDVKFSKSACRAICCKSVAEWRRFDELFDVYWFAQKAPADSTQQSASKPTASAGKGGLSGLGAGVNLFNKYSPPNNSSGAGRQTTIANADFRFLKDRNAMRQVEDMTDRLARHVRARLGRRRGPTRRRGDLALRLTLRSSVRYGGVPLVPWYTKRRFELPRLVILQDVSHSMTFNNPLLFRFTRGLVRRFNTAEVFVFHTRLFRVTPMFREPTIDRMCERLEENNKLWLGGTCIAESLAEFRHLYANEVLKPESFLIIISDGFDSNEAESLAYELKSLRQLCRRVLWLNPMLGREGFNPDTEEVWNVSRNVDHLLPAHSLNALRRCIKALNR